MWLSFGLVVSSTLCFLLISFSDKVHIIIMNKLQYSFNLNFMMFVGMNINRSCFLMIRLNLPGENTVALSANHLQKLKLSFHLSTPSGHAFKPHQVLILVFKLRGYFTYRSPVLSIMFCSGIPQTETWKWSRTHLLGWQLREKVWDNTS